MTTASEPSPSRPRRRWFRISLRGLMVLVLVVGGGIGWKVNRVRTARLAVEAIKAAGGSVLYDYQYSTDPALLNVVRKVKDPAAPAWLRQWLGDDFFRSAAMVRLAKPVAPEVLGSVARLDGLVELAINKTAGLEGAWPVLAGLSRLESVMLTGPEVNDAALATLGRIRSLRGILITGGRATDAGVATLAGLPALRSLTIGFCPALTDAGVARALAGGFPALEEFRWPKAAPAVAATVRALAEHHRGLRALTLTQTALDDADLARIGTLTNLTFLHIPQNQLPDAGLEALEPLASLENLALNNVGVGDAGMKAVGKLANLRFLDLTGTKVGDAGVAELTGLTKLTLLRLGQTPITDAAAAPLARLPALSRLIVMRTKLTDAALGPLRSLPSLRQLGAAATALTPEGIARFKADRPEVDVGTFAPGPVPPPN